MAKRAEWWNEGVKEEDYGLIRGYTHSKHSRTDQEGKKKRKKEEEDSGVPIIFVTKGEKRLHKVLVK